MTSKTVLITGTSSGIGHATAEAFLAEGWIVYATARNPADIQTLGDHENARLGTLDVTDAGDIERVAQQMVEEEGRIDCLVNNAGYAQHGPLEDVPVDDLHAQFDVNVYGPHRLNRAVLPQMREQEDGTIVNVSSVTGRLAIPGAGAYSGSKFALEAMSDALRAEVSDFGVNVVVIEPGSIETNFHERALEELEAESERTLHAYGWLYDLIEDWETVGGGPFSVPPDRVGTAIVDAACTTDPAARYRVGPWARVVEYSRFLPDSVRDRILELLRRLAT